MTLPCPNCEGTLVAFTDLPAEDRDRLETDPTRQRQSVTHRREKHAVCPDCELEVHGCDQPYAAPGRATR
jgi:hypothetical protein